MDAMDAIDHINELPKNLLSDLEIDSKGWLTSRSAGVGNADDDDNENTNDVDNNSKYPEVFPGCEKLLRLLKLIDSDDHDIDIDIDIDIDALAKDANDADGNVDVDADSNQDADADEDNITELPFVLGVYDAALAAVSQLMKMTSRKAKDDNDDSNQSSQGEIGEQPANAKAGKSRKHNEWVEVRNGDINASDEEYITEASERMQITFNTMAVLLPILVPMIHHPRQSDFDIRMKRGPSIRKKAPKQKKDKVQIPDNIMDMDGRKGKTKKTQTYLFFEHVYSVTTDGAFNLLKREIKQIVQVAHDLLVKAKGRPSNQKLFDFSMAQDIIQLLFSKDSILAPADVIQKTLLSSLDPEVERFAHEMDNAIIHPLASDRLDMKLDHENSVRNLQNRLSQILTNKFRGAHLDVYGSCLSGLSLGNSSDVDISLYIPDAWDLQVNYWAGKIDKDQYQKQMKRLVYKVYDALCPNRRVNHKNHPVKQEFMDVEAVPYARVPVVKGNYLHAENPFSHNGSMRFDICILNDIAVANSGLLREYSMLDPRVKMLMLSVKSWTKWKQIGSAADQTLSSYTWMILVIFYLQCIGFLPTLQCPKFMEAHGERYDPKNRMHTVNGLRTIFLTSDIVLKHDIWKQPEHFKTTPVSGLLAGFFLFYARHFPQETTAVSIRLGNLTLQKTVFKSSRLWRLVVEDPFETHDSSYPHDLGVPLSDVGQVKVTSALQEAANKMEKMYINCSEIEDCIGSFQFVKTSQDVEAEAEAEPIQQAKVQQAEPIQQAKVQPPKNRRNNKSSKQADAPKHKKEPMPPRKTQVQDNRDNGGKRGNREHRRGGQHGNRNQNEGGDQDDHVNTNAGADTAREAAPKHSSNSDNRANGGDQEAHVSRNEAGDTPRESAPKHSSNRNRIKGDGDQDVHLNTNEADVGTPKGRNASRRSKKLQNKGGGAQNDHQPPRNEAGDNGPPMPPKQHRNRADRRKPERNPESNTGGGDGAQDEHRETPRNEGWDNGPKPPKQYRNRTERRTAERNQDSNTGGGDGAQNEHRETPRNEGGDNGPKPPKPYRNFADRRTAERNQESNKATSQGNE